MSRTAIISTVSAVALGAAAGIGLAAAAGPGPAASTDTAAVMAQGSGFLPDLTAEDWVTYADHVVVATATSEIQGQPHPDDVKRGEGLVGRRVTFSVKDVLWSSERPARSAPQQFEFEAMGSMFKNGDQKKLKRMAIVDGSRLEAGHDYILAMVWEDAQCSPGDPMVPAQWRTLGPNAVVPYDSGVAGNGEREGKIKKQEKSKEKLRNHNPSKNLRNQVRGHSASDVKEALASTAPRTREDLRAPAGSCD